MCEILLQIHEKNTIFSHPFILISIPLSLLPLSALSLANTIVAGPASPRLSPRLRMPGRRHSAGSRRHSTDSRRGQSAAGCSSPGADGKSPTFSGHDKQQHNFLTVPHFSFSDSETSPTEDGSSFFPDSSQYLYFNLLLYLYTSH